MTDRLRSLREELERRMLSMEAKLPTSSLRRFGRAALAGMRGVRLARRGRAPEGDSLELDSLLALAASVGQLKGVAMKAGQLMSYLELQLPAEVRSALAVLQTHSPPMPFERVVEIVNDELADRAAALLGRGIDRTSAPGQAADRARRCRESSISRYRASRRE
jgi:predicted unusual protein kinase regulating ubiquinone biosynthesis (AarF/ABC1/UbiB family)